MPMRGKRKRSSLARTDTTATPDAPAPLAAAAPTPKRRATGRQLGSFVTDPAPQGAVLDGAQALRASPDSGGSSSPPRAVRPPPSAPPRNKSGKGGARAAAAKPPLATGTSEAEAKTEATAEAKAADEPVDAEADAQDAMAEEDEVREALGRAPPVHSAQLPLPWRGRLGYACLNTYLRTATPPVFSSRTCRIQSILEHRHPLQQPGQPEHATKNRPDKSAPAEVGRGMRFVQELGLANARDIVKMVRWNERFGIRFLRLSSEMFPFASHAEYGYPLAPFAAETLAAAGRVVAQLGHRVTTHPGQYTQLGSPRQAVIDAAVRDLAYHAELLDLLRLPEQQDRDAVMIMHLGGVFGDKGATLQRFRGHYAALPANVRRRLVLENDDVSWSVHDLLPLCEELDIPLVLDFHHHNIVFDASQVREGTADVVALFPRILATWERKRITPKMHYSEPTPAAVTARQRRKHSARVATLPPCPPTMDLMIEAKDKEQAVFELMRNFKLPGFDSFNDIIPHSRADESRPAKPYTKKELKERAVAQARGEPLDVRQDYVVPEEEQGMGGPEGRVYWPPGMEEWLTPVKRTVGKKDETKEQTPSSKPKKQKSHANGIRAEDEDADGAPVVQPPSTNGTGKKTKSTMATKAAATGRGKRRKATAVKEESGTESDDLTDLSDLSVEDEAMAPPKRKAINSAQAAPASARPGRRASKRVSYAEVEEGS